jgi:hypothetical protein
MAGFTTDSRPSATQLKTVIVTSTTANYSQRTLANRYISALQRLSKVEIQSADKHPVEYVYPYLHLLAVEVFARLQRESFFLEKQYYNGESARARTEALEEGWAIVHDTRLYMANSQNSIKLFAKPDSTQTENILKDYQTLMDQIQIVQGDLRDYVNRHIGMLALKDSSKSVEQATMVNRLTELAFIFIPLNFVTSAFGMNLMELGTGKAELWMVFVASAILGGIIVLVVNFALSSSKKESRGFVKLDPKASATKTLWTLMRRSWREAFWLALFMIQNSRENSETLCKALNRDHIGDWAERDHNDYPSRQPKFEFPSLPRISNPEFWEKRARQMNLLLVGGRK